MRENTGSHHIHTADLRPRQFLSVLLKIGTWENRHLPLRERLGNIVFNIFRAILHIFTL
jgi:hypothetical protein